MTKLGRGGGMNKEQVKNKLCELREAIKPLSRLYLSTKRDKLCEEVKALHEAHSDWLLVDLPWLLCKTERESGV